MGDNPVVTRIVDDKQRVVVPRLKPGESVDVTEGPNATIVLTPLSPKQVPVVRARKVNGRLTGADVKIDRQQVAAAIRAERDSR